MERFENHHKLIKYNKRQENAIKKLGEIQPNRGGKPIEDCLKEKLIK
ncbi:DnaA-like replisome organizer [Bacillus phage FI_KG-Lek]|nr:DnaA-like replisome organizer [Bacillus phage FI_KG-Lek]